MTRPRVATSVDPLDPAGAVSNTTTLGTLDPSAFPDAPESPQPFDTPPPHASHNILAPRDPRTTEAPSPRNLRTPPPRSLPREAAPINGAATDGRVARSPRTSTGTLPRSYNSTRTSSAPPRRAPGTPYPYRAQPSRVRPPLARPNSPARASGLGPLTGLGVALMLGAACICSAMLDVLLVGSPAWALPVTYLATCGYTATRVRGADWFSALVSPPLAFAAAVVLAAMAMPSSVGPGTLGVLATTFTLLAAKAKALYVGNAVAAGILLARRIKARRHELRRNEMRRGNARRPARSTHPVA
jgi:hypothetical protein